MEFSDDLDMKFELHELLGSQADFQPVFASFDMQCIRGQHGKPEKKKNFLSSFLWCASNMRYTSKITFMMCVLNVNKGS